MAKAKRILYKDMTPSQKKRAEEWADKWNRSPEECPMTFNGLIVTNKPEDMDIETYNLVALGYVDDVDDITDKIREEYRKDMEQLKDLPKVHLR